MKKNRLKQIVIASSVMLSATPVLAQFTLSGELRPRTEFRHGYKSVADSNQHSAIFTSQRTRLNFGYKTEGYQVKLVFQDIRTWGANSQLNSSDPFSSIHEAWGEAFLNKQWSFKFGRQEIVYDDHRIFGSVGWAQQARSHDAAMFKYKKEGLKIDLGFAYNQDQQQMATTSYTVPKSYKSFQYMWLHKDFSDQLKSSFLILNNGQQVNYLNTAGNPAYHDNYTQTIGTHTKYKKDKLSIAFNGYYQMGKLNTKPAKDLSAYLVGLDVVYKATDNITATLGYEMQSGNNQTDTTKAYTDVQHAFSPFYGTNHKFNGFMDYFYVGNWGGSVGLQDIYFKVKYKKNKSYIGADVHMFSAVGTVWDTYQYAEDIAGGNATPEYKEMSKGLGTELDLSFGTPLSKGVMFKGGFSMMIASETLAHLKGTVSPGLGTPYIGETNTWGYAMIIIKPTFFDSSNFKKLEKK